MNAQERGKTIDRREFLRGSAALGLAALVRRLLPGGGTPAQATRVQMSPEPPTMPSGGTADDLDHYIYLPFISTSTSLAHGPSQLGLHTQRANNAVGFVRAVHDAGAHVALVKAVEEFGYLRQVKEISPETVTVARWNEPRDVDRSGDPAEKAAWIMGQHMPHWRYEKDVVDYWEVLNEPAPPNVAEHVWLAEFYIAAMDIAEANGYRLALFSFSVGRPKWHEWEAIVETGIFARAKEGGHILALHEYGWPTTDARWGEPTEDLPPYEDRGVLTGRYRYLYRDFLIPRDEVIPLAITEGGFDPSIVQDDWDPGWKQRYVENMIWYDTKLREDSYVIGVAMYTLGGVGIWKDWDYEELLWPGNPYGTSFLDYIVSLKDK